MRHAGKLRFACLLAGLAIWLGMPAQGIAQTPVKFVLDWVFMGTQAPFSAALASGCFAHAGLDVTIDRGYGSADSISKVANGLYQFGFADPNLLVKYNHDHPDTKATLVFLVYDGGQSAIVARKSSGIATVKDLQGKNLAAPPGDNTRSLFPVFARAAGIDADTVRWSSAQPNIENMMLFRGQVDGLATLEPTTFLAVQALGMNTDQLVSFRYATYLPELLGEGIITTQKLIHQQPALVRNFVRCIVAGEEDALAHPEAAVATLRQLSPLVNTGQELTRFTMGVEMAMQNPALKTMGLGSVTPERLHKAAADMAVAFDVPVPTNMDEFYDQSFLPPLAERRY